eukprot:3292642-Alexandrium_andersonii.AAC.1
MQPTDSQLDRLHGGGAPHTGDAAWEPWAAFRAAPNVKQLTSGTGFCGVRLHQTASFIFRRF